MTNGCNEPYQCQRCNTHKELHARGVRTLGACPNCHEVTTFEKRDPE